MHKFIIIFLLGLPWFACSLLSKAHIHSNRDFKANAVKQKVVTIFFETNNFKVRLEEEQSLNNFLDQIKDTHDKFILVGHADKRGGKEYNIILGDKRARSVLAYFIEKKIDPNRFVILSKGAAQPLDNHYNKQAWAKNRRVEILHW